MDEELEEHKHLRMKRRSLLTSLTSLSLITALDSTSLIPIVPNVSSMFINVFNRLTEQETD